MLMEHVLNAGRMIGPLRMRPHCHQPRIPHASPSKPRKPSAPYAATLQRCMLALMMPSSHDGHMNVGLCASDVLPPSTHASPHLRLQAFVPSHSMQAPHQLSTLQCLTSTLQAFQVMEK